MRENFMQSKKTSLIALQAARFEGSLWRLNLLEKSTYAYQTNLQCVVNVPLDGGVFRGLLTHGVHSESGQIRHPRYPIASTPRTIAQLVQWDIGGLVRRG
jgi:hypothetical protein